MSHTRKSNQGSSKTYKGQHQFQHWYRDNQVYFITVRCHQKYPAFESEKAKQIFWDRFDHYIEKYSYTPWVTSLLDNHYHTIGYLKYGDDLPLLMKGINGSTAKLVNDVLQNNHQAGGFKSPASHPEHHSHPSTPKAASSHSGGTPNTRPISMGVCEMNSRRGERSGM